MRQLAYLTLVMAAVCLVPLDASAQCTKDIDCKGDRICVAGECQSPTERVLGTTCSLTGEVPERFVLGLATSEGKSILKTIGKAAGLENMPRVVTGPVPNAAAMIYGTERLIVYNSSFIESMRSKAGAWSVRFIFAHELGHHAEGHTISSSGSNYNTEYQADSFATRALKRMGASESQTTLAMRAMPIPASGSHPSSSARVARIRKVYRDTDVPTLNIDEDSDPLPSFPLPVPIGLASGTVTISCGCNGYVIFGNSRANPYCASGYDIATSCGGWCTGGGQVWGAVCR